MLYGLDFNFSIIGLTKHVLLAGIILLAIQISLDILFSMFRHLFLLGLLQYIWIGSFQLLRYLSKQCGLKFSFRCGIIHRQHNSLERFQEYFDSAVEKYIAFDNHKPIYIMGDFNINLLRFENCKFANNFLLSLQSYALTPVIDKTTRVHSGSATLIDNIVINQFNGQVSGGVSIYQFNSLAILTNLIGYPPRDILHYNPPIDFRAILLAILGDVLSNSSTSIRWYTPAAWIFALQFFSRKKT